MPVALLYLFSRNRIIFKPPIVFNTKLWPHTLAIFLFLLSPGRAAALESVTLQLHGTHSFQFAGYYAAIAQGYYRDIGLSVTIQEVQEGADPVNTVIENKAGYGVGDSGLIISRKTGKPVVVLAVVFQHSANILIARQTQSVHDLIGKKIVLGEHADELTAYLMSEGILQNRLIQHSNSQDIQDLINGKVDVIAAQSLYHPYYLDRANIGYQSYQPRSAGIDFYGDNLYTAEAELKDHPERAKAFRSASLRGWQYAMAHPEELTSLILAKYSQRHPRQYYLYQAGIMRKLILPDTIEIGQINPGRWRHIASTYADMDMLPLAYSLDGFLYTPDQPYRPPTLWSAATLSGLLVLLISLLGYYIYRIKLKLARSISKSKLAELHESTRSKILEQLAHGAPLEDVLKKILTSVEQSEHDVLCCFSLLDRQGKHLLTGASLRLPDFFIAALHGMEVGVGMASSGTAAFTGQRVIVSDLKNHPYWSAYSDVAQRANLSSCWSVPIHSASGKVLGTFDRYHQDSRTANEDDLLQMEKTANIAAIALDRHNTDSALKDSEKLLSDILENVSAYIYMKDIQGRYLYANRPLREMFNAPMEEIVGYQDSKFYDAATAANMRQSDLQVLQNGVSLRSEETNPNPLTGQTSVYLTIKLPLRHKDGSIYALCGISTDITEQKEIEEHIRHMAQFDALTNLPNRALFNDRLQHSFATSKRSHEHFGLLFIDLDKFKPINDTFGHAVGDMLLKEASQRMQNCVRESDTVARVGGDEFVVLLASLKHDNDAQDIAEKIRHSLNQPFNIAGHTLNISSSIGAALYPAHGDNEKELIKHADLAMYYAKENGRNNVTLYHDGLRDSK
jgi:diguanylate cyclase (GGDEF)-like protein/PAS domain S-box-containing protein